MKLRSDPICPICQEEEDMALHLLGRCNTPSLTRLTVLGLYCMDFTDLGRFTLEACESFWEIFLAYSLRGFEFP